MPNYCFELVCFTSSISQNVGLNISFIVINSQCFSQWELSLDNGSTYFDVEIVNDSIAYTTGHDGINPKIIKTTDFGETWDVVFESTYVFLDLSFPSENVGYACAHNRNIIKTIDGGESWTYLDLSETELSPLIDFRSIHFIDELHGFVTTETFTPFVIETEDGGETWTVLEEVWGGDDIYWIKS